MPRTCFKLTTGEAQFGQNLLMLTSIEITDETASMLDFSYPAYAR